MAEPAELTDVMTIEQRFALDVHKLIKATFTETDPPSTYLKPLIAIIAAYVVADNPSREGVSERVMYIARLMDRAAVSAQTDARAAGIYETRRG